MVTPLAALASFITLISLVAYQPAKQALWLWQMKRLIISTNKALVPPRVNNLSWWRYMPATPEATCATDSQKLLFYNQLWKMMSTSWMEAPDGAETIIASRGDDVITELKTLRKRWAAEGTQRSNN